MKRERLKWYMTRGARNMVEESEDGKLNMGDRNSAMEFKIRFERRIKRD